MFGVGGVFAVNEETSVVFEVGLDVKRLGDFRAMLRFAGEVDLIEGISSV